MCNRYANKVPFTQYVDELNRLHMPLLAPKPAEAPNLEPRENIAPTDQAPILLPLDDGLELRSLRWGLIPWFHKGAVKEWKFLTTNARVETVKTTKTYKSAYEKRRCLIPVSYFYEWTGEKGKKTKWAFGRPSHDWFCFAGIFDRAHTTEGPIESFALLTTEAGPDMRPYHHRQPVIIDREHYSSWLKGASLPDEAVHPLAQGRLSVQRATS